VVIFTRITNSALKFPSGHDCDVLFRISLSYYWLSNCRFVSLAFQLVNKKLIIPACDIRESDIRESGIRESGIRESDIKEVRFPAHNASCTWSLFPSRYRQSASSLSCTNSAIFDFRSFSGHRLLATQAAFILDYYTCVSSVTIFSLGTDDGELPCSRLPQSEPELIPRLVTIDPFSLSALLKL